MTHDERRRWRILLRALGYTTSPEKVDISPTQTIALAIVSLGTMAALMGWLSH